MTETQNSRAQAEKQGALDSHDTDVQQSGGRGTESQQAEAEASERADKQAASGLELGLMAGLLPLQQEASAGSLAAKPMEQLGAPLSASSAMPGTSIGKDKVVHDEQKQSVQSTSQESREVSQTSTGEPHSRHDSTIRSFAEMQATYTSNCRLHVQRKKRALASFGLSSPKTDSDLADKFHDIALWKS